MLSVHYTGPLANALGSCSYILFHIKPVVNFQVEGPKSEAGEGAPQKAVLCLFIVQVWGGWRAGKAPGALPNQSSHLGHWASPRGCCTQSTAFLCDIPNRQKGQSSWRPGLLLLGCFKNLVQNLNWG